jgi:hypothetical protein
MDVWEEPLAYLNVDVSPTDSFDRDGNLYARFGLHVFHNAQRYNEYAGDWWYARILVQRHPQPTAFVAPVKPPT